jgi:glycosyltransferase involved in cell wall biosynthesis
MSTKPQPEADIALVLEGTYPYVRGGVSSWVDQIIRAFPDYRFTLLFIGGQPEQYGKMQYSLPSNVVGLKTTYVHAQHDKPPVQAESAEAGLIEFVHQLHEGFRNPQTGDLDRGLEAKMFALLAEKGKDTAAQFLHSRDSWEYLCRNYQQRCPDKSFLEYFWTVRAIHEPIWVLSQFAAEAPPARLYHTVSTGYAGFLGAMLRRRSGRPLVLTEHGIYTKERKIDLAKSEWFARDDHASGESSQARSHLQYLWTSLFETLGRFCYREANPILSLFETNRQRQVQDGADPDRTRVIPNGVDVERFAALRLHRPADPPPVLCLIGRVVSIKDVKTFIRALRSVVTRIPRAEGWIVGPTDEDEDYALECRHLVETLGLSRHVKFLGHQKVDDILPKVGLLVLSSISEGLPLVLLEGFAAGVPAVSTDVGACRQLVYGTGLEEVTMGAAGAIVGLADPSALADAAVSLLSDHGKWRSAQEAAIRRVETFYTQQGMFASYRDVYEQAMRSWQESDSNFVNC